MIHPSSDMTPAQYQEVLAGLDRTLLVFEGAASQLTEADRQLLVQLSKLRATVLRAETCHPFHAPIPADQELDPDTTRPPFAQ